MASPSGPEDPSADGSSPTRREEGLGPPRDVPPPRPLPRPPRRRPAPRPPDAALPPASADGAERAEDEPVWLRERREEHEFTRQFGEWRAGGRRPTRRGGAGPAVLLRVLLLAVLVAVAVLILLH